MVVNMQQRRTVAAGRQNQDPNTGRGRQMVLAALQKKQAPEEVPLAVVRTSRSGKNLLGGSAKRNGYSEGAPAELIGNELSISDIRKRHLDQEEPRAPLSSLYGSSQEEPEDDWTDWTDATSVKSSPKEGTVVYKKRRRIGTTPPTPPLRSSGRGTTEKASPLPSPVLETNSPSLRKERESSPEAPTTEQVLEIDNLHPVRRQLMSTSTPKEEGDPYGFSIARENLEEGSPVALLGDSEPQVLGFESPYLSFVPPSPRMLQGLMNLGNTCYMNAIVQCLNNLSSFVTGMERFFGPLMKQNVLEDSETFVPSDVESIHAALLTVFRDLKRAETVNPSVLKHAFALHQLSFWGCMQQDAHEFFCSLIDQVQEDVLSELKKQYSKEADRPKLETVCPTTQNFSCSVRNNLTCAGCGNVTSVEETYRDFSLALPEDERTHESKECSLESLLSLYFQESTMSRKCDKCGVEDTKAQAQILELPHVLVLQLKRLHMDRDVPCTKVSAPVKFTSRLDIGPWCAQDKRKFWSPTIDDVQNGWGISSEESMDCGLASSSELESHELRTTLKANSSSTDVCSCYRLHGVVNHLGSKTSGGHFFTNILNPEAARWLRCDDSLVTEVSEDSVFALEREAYMFFYVHESTNL